MQDQGQYSLVMLPATIAHIPQWYLCSTSVLPHCWVLLLLAPPHIHSPSNSKWGKYITGRRIKLNWRCLWLERILQSPFNNVILYFIRVVNRPIEDVMVEYDKTSLSGRHIHSLFDLMSYAGCCCILCYPALLKLGPKPKQYKSLLVSSTASNEGPHEGS